jgi:hypothetical protein
MTITPDSIIQDSLEAMVEAIDGRPPVTCSFVELPEFEAWHTLGTHSRFRREIPLTPWTVFASMLGDENYPYRDPSFE